MRRKSKNKIFCSQRRPGATVLQYEVTQFWFQISPRFFFNGCNFFVIWIRIDLSGSVGSGSGSKNKSFASITLERTIIHEIPGDLKEESQKNRTWHHFLLGDEKFHRNIFGLP